MNRNKTAIGPTAGASASATGTCSKNSSGMARGSSNSVVTTATGTSIKWASWRKPMVR